MMDIALNENGTDLDLTGLDLSLVEGKEAVTQEIKIGLRFFRGEWFLDTRVGVPYFQKIFTGEKTVQLGAVAAVYRRALLSVPGVLSVSKCEALFDDDASLRQVNVTWECTVDDATTIEGVEALVIP